MTASRQSRRNSAQDQGPFRHPLETAATERRILSIGVVGMRMAGPRTKLRILLRIFAYLFKTVFLMRSCPRYRLAWLFDKNLCLSSSHELTINLDNPLKHCRGGKTDMEVILQQVFIVNSCEYGCEVAVPINVGLKFLSSRYFE